MHPFERANLGKAPFRCVGVTKNLFTIPGCPEATKPGSSCDYCGTGITYEYWIVSADGRKFKVGCDCVTRTSANVEGFDAERKKHLAEIRALANTARRERREMTRAAERQMREAQWAQEKLERAARFEKDEPEVQAFLLAITKDSNEFLVRMRDAMLHYGSLTEGQLNAVKNNMAREKARAEEREKSTFIGEVGKRITGKFEIVASRSWRQDFYPHHTAYWFLLKCGEHVCTYKGTSFLGEKGETFEAAFTVKEHDTYQGTRQTKLARPHIKEPAKEAS